MALVLILLVFGGCGNRDDIWNYVPPGTVLLAGMRAPVPDRLREALGLPAAFREVVVAWDGKEAVVVERGRGRAGRPPAVAQRARRLSAPLWAVATGGESRNPNLNHFLRPLEEAVLEGEFGEGIRVRAAARYPDEATASRLADAGRALVALAGQRARVWHEGQTLHAHAQLSEEQLIALLAAAGR